MMRTSFASLAGASLKSPLLAGRKASFDALCTHAELRRALSYCIDSAVGLDGLPYSLKVNFPSWQDAILNIYNLVCSWSHRPDPAETQCHRPCLQKKGAFSSNELSAHFSGFMQFQGSRIASIGPNSLMNLTVASGGAPTLVGLLVSVLSSRSSSHTFVAFVDIQKAFDTSWVEGTLVRLFDAGVSPTLFPLLSKDSKSALATLSPSTGPTLAQGRVLSPHLFNLLVNGLAASVPFGVAIISLANCTLTIW